MPTLIAAKRTSRLSKPKLAGSVIQKRLVQIELATVSALRALQMDINGDAANSMGSGRGLWINS